LDERSTWEMLELAGIALRKKKLQLAQLDMGTDAFPLVVVPLAKFATLTRLAKRAKYNEANAFGDHLAAAQKERLAQMKKDEHAKKKPKAPELPWAVYAKGRQTWSIQVAPIAFLAGYEKPGVKRYEDHYFSSKAECATAAKRRVAAWKADGFVKLTPAQ